jgi:DUF1365 family protein
MCRRFAGRRGLPLSLHAHRPGVANRTVARIDYDDANGPLLQTSVSGTLEPSRPALRRALWRYPAMTLGVVLRIHWQACAVAQARAPFFSKPDPRLSDPLTTRCPPP